MDVAKRLLLVFFLSLAFAGGAFFLYLAFQGGAEQPARATILPEPRPLPALSLVDHTGAAFTRENFEGGWQLVFFGFTHCPDVCPATLQQLAIAKRRVAAAGGSFPEIVLISVDPERDTPDVLADYVRHFGDGVRGVTGSLEAITSLTGQLGIFFARSAPSESGYSVDHSAAVLVIDPDGDWHSLFSAPHDVDSFVRDIPLLTAAR